MLQMPHCELGDLTPREFMQTTTGLQLELAPTLW